MRVFLLAVGSQGDIRPLVSLANRLHREGHEAMLAAPPLFKPLAIAGRIPFAPLDVDMMSVGDAMASSHGVRHFAQLARTLGGLTETVLASAWAAASDSGADVVVHHPVLPMGQHIAERLGVPAVIGLPQPALVPTGEFSSPIWSNTARLPRAVHRASYPVATMQLGLWCRRGIDRWRAEAGLPRRPGRHDPLRSPGSPGSTGGTESATPVLHAFSRHVLPRPADWPTNAQVSGYWFLDTPPEWTPPRKLAAFLDAGDPPVYIGFGSMPIEDPGALSALVQETVERVGTRAVIASGYQGLRGLASSDTGARHPARPARLAVPPDERRGAPRRRRDHRRGGRRRPPPGDLPGRHRPAVLGEADARARGLRRGTTPARDDRASTGAGSARGTRRPGPAAAGSRTGPAGRHRGRTGPRRLTAGTDRFRYSANGGITPMTVLTLPTGVERRVLHTARGPVVASYARPRPENDLGATVLLVTGYVGSKEDFWSVLPGIAEAGYHAWSYDQIGQFESAGPLEAGAVHRRAARRGLSAGDRPDRRRRPATPGRALPRRVRRAVRHAGPGPRRCAA